MAREPNIDNTITDGDNALDDPADAFVRNGASTPPKPDREPKRGKGKKSARADREPKVDPPETTTIEKVDDDPGMDPMDAVEEIANTLDNLFMVARMLRDYPMQIELPDGTRKALPDPADKERLKKALVRFMGAAGVQIGPGPQLALCVFSTYVGPAMSIELTRAVKKKMGVA